MSAKQAVEGGQQPCVLAYSGGLDTSAIVVWLVEKGYEVHAVLVDVGQNEDLEAARVKALRLGAVSAVIADAKPKMCKTLIPQALRFAATYEGNYRLGTALARPFIALEQIKLAKKLGGATLVHGATGKGNDQVRFEYAYRTLAPECAVLAPWKVWSFGGRQDLVAYLNSKGFEDAYEVHKEFSLDENLWHLSIEGGPLERGAGMLDIEAVLDIYADYFAEGKPYAEAPKSVELTFEEGIATAVNGVKMPMIDLLGALNQQYRHAPWAWDLVLENRMTGIKSRGVYINPAAKLLHTAINGLARACFNKPLYDQYVRMGSEYGHLLYRGEYFTPQRQMIEAAGASLCSRLTGTVTVQLEPQPYLAKIDAAASLFTEELATFEASSYDHHDAEGFVKLSWLSQVGQSGAKGEYEDVMETDDGIAPDLCADQPVAGAGLVSASS